MNAGAYGTYPGYLGLKRRRYNIGRYITKKYGSTVTPYRRRYVNPVNQFTYRKTRVGRLTKTDMQSVKCTYNDAILLAASSQTYQFAISGQPYSNLTNMIQASTEFASRQTQYSYYMLNGMQVKLTRRWIDPIAYGVDGVSAGFTATTYNGNGLATIQFNLYPNLTNTVVGAPVQNADSSWEVSPFITTVNSHYQPFPKNFTTGTNSNGLGVWNATNQIANLAGELACFNDAGAAASDVSSIAMWDVEINFYIAFCNNTGS